MAAAGGRLTIILDSGNCRGGDILKAFALGADVVLCGRAAPLGAAVVGEAGVLHALKILEAEVGRDLALMGCTGMNALAADCVAAHHLQVAPG